MGEFQNTIIYLLGFPGTGKYTIAREICRLRPEVRLVDNHLINNPIFSIIHTDGKSPLPERVWVNLEIVWRAVLDTMVHISSPDYSFVLTNYLSQNSSSDIAWFYEVEKMAKAREATFIPVLLTIEPNEHAKRIVQPDRAKRFKCTDPEAPQRYAAEDELVRVDHKNVLKLDVTKLSANDAARIILEHGNMVTGNTGTA